MYKYVGWGGEEEEDGMESIICSYLCALYACVKCMGSARVCISTRGGVGGSSTGRNI